VLPALDDHWLRDSLAVLFLEQHLQLFDNTTITKSCGPASLAAFVGAARVESLEHLAAKGLCSWMNRRNMESTLRELGLPFTKHGETLPGLGIAMIQWQGPWSKNAYRGSELSHTHWIAVAENYVFDVMWGRWLPKSVWQEVIVDDLLRQKGAHGWKPLTGYEFVLAGFLDLVQKAAVE
tara:strand:+ start:814 stop:1350 length:537 start_codon:yes stop_codon:yes gene_type:complete